jgi:superfamily I DNA/RNA helicase
VLSDLGAGTSAELEEERRLLYVAMTWEGRSPPRRSAALLCSRGKHPNATPAFGCSANDPNWVHAVAKLICFISAEARFGYEML